MHGLVTRPCINVLSNSMIFYVCVHLIVYTCMYSVVGKSIHLLNGGGGGGLYCTRMYDCMY